MLRAWDFLEGSKKQEKQFIEFQLFDVNKMLFKTVFKIPGCCGGSFVAASESGRLGLQEPGFGKISTAQRFFSQKLDPS